MNLVMVLAATFVPCVLLLAVLARSAPELGLIDKPSGHKTHELPTPVVGGLAMALSLLVVPALGLLPPQGEWLYLGIAAMGLIGLVDDRWQLSARVKLTLMACAFTVVLYLSDLLLLNLGELLPGVSVATGIIAFPLTLFAAVGLVNAFNLIDGVDGLAGTVAMCQLLVMFFIAQTIGADEWGPFIVAALAVVTAFLCFNMRLPKRQRARLFMGDTGSLVMGFILFWLSVSLSQRESGAVSPMLMVWVMAYPMVDTVATMVLRLGRGKSIFTPGKDHFHHLLSRLGLRTESVVGVCAVLTAALGSVGVLLWWSGLPEWISLLLFVGFSALYVTVVTWTWRSLERAEYGDVRSNSPNTSNTPSIANRQLVR